MKKFFWGFVIGAVIAFLLGMNVGKGKRLLSNPFADKPLVEQAKDLGKKAIEQGKETAGELTEKSSETMKESVDKVKETAGKITDQAREAIHDATKSGDKSTDQESDKKDK